MPLLSTIFSDLQDTLMQAAKQIRVEIEDLWDKKMEGLYETMASVLQGLIVHPDCTERRADELCENVEGKDRPAEVEDVVEIAQNDTLYCRDLEFILRRGLENDKHEKLARKAVTDLVMIPVCVPDEILRKKVYRVNLGVAHQRNSSGDVAVCSFRRSCYNGTLQAYYLQRFQTRYRLNKI